MIYQGQAESNADLYHPSDAVRYENFEFFLDKTLFFLLFMYNCVSDWHLCREIKLSVPATAILSVLPLHVFRDTTSVPKAEGSD